MAEMGAICEVACTPEGLPIECACDWCRCTPEPDPLPTEQWTLYFIQPSPSGPIVRALPLRSEALCKEGEASFKAQNTPPETKTVHAEGVLSHIVEAPQLSALCLLPEPAGASVGLALVLLALLSRRRA